MSVLNMNYFSSIWIFMDFVFVMDCSNSMGDKGDDNSLNARFYSMQSKIADVAEELLSSAEYDCAMFSTVLGSSISKSSAKSARILSL